MPKRVDHDHRRAWVHREYRRLFEPCLRDHWPEFQHRPPVVRTQLLRSLITFQLLRDWALAGRGGDTTEKAAWISR